MPSRTDIQVVCFDIGGVLARIVDHWSHACALAGVPLRDQFVADDQRRTLVAASQHYETGRLDTDGFAAAICGCSAYQPAEVLAVLQRWIIGLYPGIDELLAEVTAAGVATALLSNTNELHWRQMMDPAGPFTPLQLIPESRRFASQNIGARKPEPAAYEHVERALGAKAESILFFDDLESNVNGAVWAHWHTERIDPTGDTAAQLRKHLKRYGVM
jgi:putative hydrolase of the HAD superfamily